MRFCKIENNKVTNIIKGSQEFIDKLDDNYVVYEDGVKTGTGYIDGAFVFPIVDEIVKTLDELKTEKLKQNTANAKAKIDLAFDSYEQWERDTFPTQQREYEDYQLDNTTPTTYIDSILIDGESKDDLLAKVGMNISYIASVQKTMRQNAKDIKSCGTIEELDTIVL